MNSGGNITGLLNRWSDGDSQAGNALTPLVYDELHRIAQRVFSSENSGHTLQPTALVHECYVNLIKVDVSWQDRAHFYSLAARMMRRLLVNHATSRNAAKRGGGAVHISMDDSQTATPDTAASLLDLDAAITDLSAMDERKADLIQLQCFGGLSFREMEEVTGLSSSTLDRELRFARAWIKTRFDGDGD